jgi:hypothetical protein
MSNQKKFLVEVYDGKKEFSSLSFMMMTLNWQRTRHKLRRQGMEEIKVLYTNIGLLFRALSADSL